MIIIKKIILASSSPRRKAILEQAGILFEVMPSDIDERYIHEISPHDLARITSFNKAMYVYEKLNTPCIIIGADTIVSHHGKIFGKPSDKHDAFRSLKFLQGKDHLVFTGVTLINKNEDSFETASIVDSTRVIMKKMTDNEIWRYVETGEPLDKAGSYAIQGKGGLFVESIEGDYFNVVGLPLAKIYDKLREFGLNVSDLWKKDSNPEI